jgi:hypothetical protein
VSWSREPAQGIDRRARVQRIVLAQQKVHPRFIDSRAAHARHQWPIGPDDRSDRKPLSRFHESKVGWGERSDAHHRATRQRYQNRTGCFLNARAVTERSGSSPVVGIAALTPPYLLAAALPGLLAAVAVGEDWINRINHSAAPSEIRSHGDDRDSGAGHR